MAKLLKEHVEQRAREDREYQKYGHAVAERMIAAGRGHRYRIRKYRRKNAELGWWLARRTVMIWLKKWHVSPSLVVGMTNTTQLRDGKVRETATIISCVEAFKNGVVHEWQVAVPGQWPMQGQEIPRILK